MAIWIVFTKFVKLLGHFIRYPSDIILLPISIVFGYFHGFIKLYALLTLNVVSPECAFSYTFMVLTFI
jgi:hypothetical protein